MNRHSLILIPLAALVAFAGQFASAAAPAQCNFPPGAYLVHRSSGADVDIWSQMSSGGKPTKYCIVLAHCVWAFANSPDVHLEALIPSTCQKVRYVGDTFECEAGDQAHTKLAAILESLKAFLGDRQLDCNENVLPAGWQNDGSYSAVTLPLRTESACLRLIVQAREAVRTLSLVSPDCDHPALGSAIPKKALDAAVADIGLLFDSGGFLFPLSGIQGPPSALRPVVWGSLRKQYVIDWVRTIASLADSSGVQFPAEDDPLPGASRVQPLARVLRTLVAAAQRLKAEPFNNDQGWDDKLSLQARDWMTRLALSSSNPNAVLRGERARASP